MRFKDTTRFAVYYPGRGFAATNADPSGEGNPKIDTTGGGGAPSAPPPAPAPPILTGNNPGGEWEKWCDANPGVYGGRVDICKRDYTGGIGTPFAPWTDAGKAARWLVIKPEEFDPENLFVVAFTDQIRFATLATAATFVVPLLGNAYVLQFLTPQGWIIAIEAAMLRGGPQRVWEKLLEPVFTDKLDQLWAVMQYGPSPQAVISYFLKREAARPSNTGMPSVILTALSNNLQLIKLLSDPKNISKPDTLIQLSAVLSETVKSLAGNASGNAVLGAVKMFADALAMFAQPISILIQKGAAGLPEALDIFSGQILGIRISAIRTGGIQAAQSLGAKIDPAKMDIFKSIRDVFDSIALAVSKVQWKDLQKGLEGVIGAISGPLNAIADTINQVGGQLAKVIPAPTPVPPPAQVPAQIPLPLPPLPSPQPLPAPIPVPPSIPLPPRVPPVPIPLPNTQTVDPLAIPAVPGSSDTVGKGKLNWAAIAIAAGAGTLIGGPVGALVGGGAAAITTRKKS